MTPRIRFVTFGFSGLALTALLSYALQAQPRPTASTNGGRAGTVHSSLHDALSRPFAFPFSKPTTLDQVVAHLSTELNAPVALDRAALDRLDVRPDDTVQLDLKGARLKTGLKLLLDQLDLTYRVEEDDNLLVITDQTGATDPLDHVLDELKALHRDVHDVQDAVEEIRAAMGLGEGGEKLRKPTIIEEVPPAGTGKSKDALPPSTTPSARSRPGV